MKRRVLFHVQHLLGIWHLKRAEILTEAMAGVGLDVTVAYGGLPVEEVPFRGVRVAYLPPATIANEDFSNLLDGSGRPVDDAWRSARRDARAWSRESRAAIRPRPRFASWATRTWYR